MLAQTNRNGRDAATRDSTLIVFVLDFIVCLGDCTGTKTIDCLITPSPPAICGFVCGVFRLVDVMGCGALGLWCGGVGRTEREG